ncbi:FkbM family methyltransferase [Paenibacillus methanolicus]|uniref:FkbM family methyltransferase n=1 Tax=Paenibacillus methanolicus TaxID=582686 RepID=A0A5S5C981_9BACL|nr:FkbM family methyltransferase [Paenibacillus methanolicus]TYP75729.1 FkbM family methyltransferase [Paenibacillus methanolicus]
MNVNLSQKIESDIKGHLAALEADVNDEEALLALANAIIDHNLLAEAIPVMLQPLFGQASLDLLLSNLGITFWSIKQLDYVIPLLQESLAINPTNADARYNLAYVLHSIGEHELALSCLEASESQSEETLSLLADIKQSLRPSFFDEYKVEQFNIEGVPHPVYARTETSDPFALQQIFRFHEYSFPDLTFSPKLIIDGGANAGYASVWFANLYPGAKIIAVEPDKSNFDVMQYNTKPYTQVEPVHSGLWNKNTYLNVRDVGLGKWGTMVLETDEPDESSFKAVTIQSLFENSGFDEIDILKLDIEGAEREVFSEGFESWLGKVKMIIIELHDAMKRGCSHAFFKAINQYDFGLTLKGENLVLTRSDLFYAMYPERL